MASTIKVDVVRPTATNGSLSLKGDSGGSATTNGITVNSSGNTSITGTTTVSSLTATTVTDLGTVTTCDINGGTIDGTAIGSNSSSTGIFSSAAIGTSISSTAKLNFNISNSDPTVSAIDAIKNMAGPSADNENIAQFYGYDSGIGNTGIEICNKGTGGLNTNSAKALAVKASGSDALVVTGTGRVDISTSAKIDTINEYTSATGVTVDGVLLKDSTVNVADGAAATPSITNASDTNTGVYFPAADTVGISTGGSEAMRIDSSGNLKFNSGYGSVTTAYGCRAWVNFNGTGTVAIRDSGNVSSITDNGTGDYTVNFTTAMPDANYCIGSMVDRGAGGPGGSGSQVTVNLDNNTSYNYLTAGSARLITSRSLDNIHYDSLVVCAAFFR